MHPLTHTPARLARGAYSVLTAVAIGLLAACSDDPSPVTGPSVGTPTALSAKVPRLLGKIAFVRGPTDATSIWVMAGDGANAVRITADGRFDDPSLSADGKRVAYVVRDALVNVPVITIASVNGGGAKPLVAGEWPRWSPDGTKIVYQKLVGDRFQVFVVNTNGSGLKQLTDTPNAAAFHPAWSPDGRKIVFVSNATLIPEIYVMDADGTDQTRITDCEAEAAICIAPTWSPDLTDDRIAYTIGDPVAEIRTIRPDGTGRKTVFAAPEVALAMPTWSPDAARIAFHASLETPGVSQIFSVFRDGTDLRRLTFSGVEDARPSWSR